ncbi:MAG: InlB B-repeat-containing protein [Lachnospiraceae bacterium]|nr:InlB B-repeat-containing protein [Lachnospiraceae bacterium]
MKKVLFKRIAVFFLISVLLCSNSLFLYAEEVGEGVETPDAEVTAVIEEPAEPGGSDDNVVTDGNAGSGDTVDNQNGQQSQTGSLQVPVLGRKFSVNTDVLSFGTIKTNEVPMPLSFVITNDSTSDELNLGWSQTDVTGIFRLNMPSEVNNPIAPGGHIQGTVEVPKEKIQAGDFASTIVFTDLDTNAKAEIRVSLRVESAAPGVNKIKIWPGNTYLRQGDSMKFDVTVEGYNNPDTGVTWSLQGQNSSGTSIDNDGYLRVAGDESASYITVIATSNQNNSYRDTASVSISKDRYVVNAWADPAKGGYINGAGNYNGGDRATLTAVALEGYSFDEWVTADDMSHVSSSASFTTDKITKNLSYRAIFIESEFKIKVKSSDEDMGTVKGGGYVKKGDNTTIEAKPKTGYDFDGWYENDKLVSHDKKVKITDVKKSHTFVAQFKEERYVVKVSASPSEGGSVSGEGEYESGDTVNLSASPAPGYFFKGYEINNQIISNSEDYRITGLDRDLSITALFEKEGTKNHTIESGVANAGGVITPSGKASVAEGGSITYTIAPDNGYGVLMVSVDGEQKGAYTTFTFNNIKRDHTISVAFAPIEDPVNEVEMDKIITTKEAEAIAVAKLRQAGRDSEERSSVIVTTENYQEYLQEEMGEIEGDTDTITAPQEQNLVGMDNTEDLSDVVNIYNPDKAVGVYQALDITRETAEKLIDGNGDGILINEAYELGYLDILINNEYMVPGKEGEVLDLENDNTVKNLQEVVRACLTKEEKLKLLDGNEIVVSFTISGAENPGEYEKQAVKSAKGVSIDRYLYITLMKTVDGVPSLVEKLDTPMRLTMEIPEELRDSEAKFCIVRNHNGEVDVLEDLDDDPNTITIETDRFSPYAIGHFSNTNYIVIFIAIAVAFAAALFILLTFINMRGNGKKKVPEGTD